MGRAQDVGRAQDIRSLVWVGSCPNTRARSTALSVRIKNGAIQTGHRADNPPEAQWSSGAAHSSLLDNSLYSLYSIDISTSSPAHAAHSCPVRTLLHKTARESVLGRI